MAIIDDLKREVLRAGVVIHDLPAGTEPAPEAGRLFIYQLPYIGIEGEKLARRLLIFSVSVVDYEALDNGRRVGLTELCMRYAAAVETGNRDRLYL